MTEREKMLAGELYDCGDPELLERWHRAKDLARIYNSLESADSEGKDKILDEMLGGRGKNLWITPPFYVDYGNNIYFGNNCEVNMNCTFLDDNRIVIGDNALIAPNVQIYTAFHPTNAQDRFGQPKPDGSFEFCKTQTAPVMIGDNVWIGGGVIILPGVTIGNNVVIGAGSVVTKDIPDDVIAYGNPCRVIRENGRNPKKEKEEDLCRTEAEELLKEGGEKNPGPWISHSRYVAEAAEKVAVRCEGIDENTAYICGLLHDIGRRFGVTYLAHVYDGYEFLKKLGYERAARTALTHSFNRKVVDDYIGKFDISEEKQNQMQEILNGLDYDDYDYLIQLCDAVATAEGIVSLEERMNDVRRRYGHYPQEKWDRNMELKAYFEEKMGCDLYEVLSPK